MGGSPSNGSVVDARRLRFEPGVDFTFDPTTHTYTAGGVQVPSVTQVLKMLSLGADFSRVDPEVLDHKRQLGILVHDACAILDEGDDLDWDALGEAHPYVEGYRKFKLDTRFEPRLIEYHTIAVTNVMRYGMKLDREGILNREPVVLDIKTAENAEPTWGLQLVAYALGLPRPCLPPFEFQRLVVQLRPNRTYRLHTYTDPDDAGTFKSALYLAYWLIRHGKKLQ